MDQPGPRFWEIFFEVYENLPRQGPGNRDLRRQSPWSLPRTSRIPRDPRLGVRRRWANPSTRRTHVRFDRGNRQPCAEHRTAEGGHRSAWAFATCQRNRWRYGPPGAAAGSFDLIWSEGALYNIGLRNALRVCHGLLRPGGYLAFTDAVWRKEDPPPEVKAGFDLDYPTMGWLDDDVAAIRDCGFELVGHFTLPDEAWWDDFYTPMEKRIAELRGKYDERCRSLGHT